MIRRKPNQAPTGIETGIAAPTAGLNTRQPLAGLSQKYAVTLDNLVCQPDALVSRLGTIAHSDGFAEPPKSFLTYYFGNTAALFAACDDGVFNATGVGTVGAAVHPLTNGDCDSVNFSTSGGHFVVGCNGVDPVFHYDGSVWAEPAITGVAPEDLVSVETYRQRLYFLANNTLGFWYLPVDSVAGAAALFRLGSIFRRGGKVVGVGTWTIDGGQGSDDHIAFVTNQGEVAIFVGGDPADPNDWYLRGVYWCGRPLGRKPFFKLGGDLLLLTENGLVPLSRLLQTVTTNYQQAVTREIETTFTAQAQLYGSFPGWQVTVFPKYAVLLVNIPQGDGQAIQYVMNTISGGWSRFTGWGARAFVEFNGGLYFATGLTVVKAFEGYSDLGAAIPWTMDTAYNRFNTPRQLKPLAMRPLVAVTGPLDFQIGFAMDFSGNYITQSASIISLVGDVWDTGLWDTALWGGGAFYMEPRWYTVASKGGLAVSTRLQGASREVSALIVAVDYYMAKQGLMS